MGSLDARRIAALMVESSNICVEKTVATGVDRDGDFHHGATGASVLGC